MSITNEQIAEKQARFDAEDEERFTAEVITQFDPASVGFGVGWARGYEEGKREVGPKEWAAGYDHGSAEVAGLKKELENVRALLCDLNIKLYGKPNSYNPYNDGWNAGIEQSEKQFAKRLGEVGLKPVSSFSNSTPEKYSDPFEEQV